MFRYNNLEKLKPELAYIKEIYERQVPYFQYTAKPHFNNILIYIFGITYVIFIIIYYIIVKYKYNRNINKNDNYNNNANINNMRLHY